MNGDGEGGEEIVQTNQTGSIRTKNDLITLIVEGERSLKLEASKHHLYEQGSYFKAMENFREGNQPEIVLKLPPGLENCTKQHEASTRCECILCCLLTSKSSKKRGRGRPKKKSTITTTTALQLIQAADYFGFAEVISSTVELLNARLETDCLQIQGALEIPELADLKERAKQFSLCLFVALGSTALGRGGSADPFLLCSAATMRELMVCPKLNCSSESVLRAILEHWATLTGEDVLLVEELVESWKKVERQLPLFPCVMGQRRAARGELTRRGTEGGGACRRGEAALLAFNPLSGEWRGGMDIGSESCLDSTGFKAASAEYGNYVCRNGELCENRVYNGQVRTMNPLLFKLN